MLSAIWPVRPPDAVKVTVLMPVVAARPALPPFVPVAAGPCAEDEPPQPAISKASASTARPRHRHVHGRIICLPYSSVRRSSSCRPDAAPLIPPAIYTGRQYNAQHRCWQAPWRDEATSQGGVIVGERACASAIPARSSKVSTSYRATP